jgi:hypothetical protein
MKVINPGKNTTRNISEKSFVEYTLIWISEPVYQILEIQFDGRVIFSFYNIRRKHINRKEDNAVLVVDI